MPGRINKTDAVYAGRLNVYGFVFRARLFTHQSQRAEQMGMEV